MTATIDNLPVYEALITDEATGMMRISLVDDPAVMSNFLTFNNERKPLMYAVEDEDRKLVRGVVMRADFPIYRRDEGGEFYVIYKADTIRKMAEKYLKEGRSNLVNLMHREGSDVDCVDMVQFFIKDTANGMAPAGFEEIADGSLFAEFHVTSEVLWKAIKDGTFKGFSLEGVFELAPEQDDDLVDGILDELEGLFTKQKNHRTMTKKERILAALEKLLIKCGNVTTDKGVLVWDGEADLKAGLEVFVEDAEGNRSAAEDGNYITEDGKTIVVAGGKVAEILDPQAEVAPQEDAPADEEMKRKGCKAEGEDAPAGEDPKEEEKDKIREELDDIWEAINAILEALKGNSEVVEQMKATLSKVSAAPAARPAHEEVIEAGTTSKTGVRGLDNLARRLAAK